MNTRVIIVLGTLVNVFLTVDSWTPFSLRDCTNHTDRVLTVEGGLTSYPVTIPGQVSAPGTIVVHRPVNGGYRLDVVVEKYFVFDYFMLPCVSNVGSCSYDVCDLLGWFRTRGCPWQVSRSNIPCTCPYDAASYTMGAHPFYIPGVQGVWSWIAYGDFRVTGKLIEESTGEEVNCYSVEFTVQQARTWDYFYWW